MRHFAHGLLAGSEAVVGVLQRSGAFLYLVFQLALLFLQHIHQRLAGLEGFGLRGFPDQPLMLNAVCLGKRQ